MNRKTGVREAGFRASLSATPEATRPASGRDSCEGKQRGRLPLWIWLGHVGSCDVLRLCSGGLIMCGLEQAQMTSVLDLIQGVILPTQTL